MNKFCYTCEPPIEMRIGGHLEARVRQQETADFGEAGVDVSADILELLVLVLFHLNTSQALQLISDLLHLKQIKTM